MRLPIRSFSSSPETDLLIKHLQEKSPHQVSKSALIRSAVRKLADQEGIPDMTTSIAKAEQVVGEFFEKAVSQPSSNYAVVKREAGEMLKAYLRSFIDICEHHFGGSA